MGTWSFDETVLRTFEELGHALAADEVVLPALKEAGQPLKEDIVRTFPRSKYAPHMADTFVVVESEGQVLVGPRAGKVSEGWKVPFVEFGTSKMAARPTIRPAFDSWKRDFAAKFVAAARPLFERVLRGFRAPRQSPTPTSQWPKSSSRQEFLERVRRSAPMPGD